VAHTIEPLSSIPLELYSFDLHLTLYCDNIVETVSTLKQFAALEVSQTLRRLQFYKEYSLWEYPVQ